MKMNRSPVAVFLLGAVLLISVLVLGTNLENVRVSAGYACYVYARPIFGKSAFEKVIFGPASTGLRWRLEGQREDPRVKMMFKRRLRYESVRRTY